MKEKTVERHLVAEIEKAGGMALKFPPIFFAGFPDRIVLLPGAVIVFVETKAPGKTARKLQARVHAKLRRIGFRVEVLDTKDAVDGFMLTL